MTKKFSCLVLSFIFLFSQSFPIASARSEKVALDSNGIYQSVITAEEIAAREGEEVHNFLKHPSDFPDDFYNPGPLSRPSQEEEDSKLDAQSNDPFSNSSGTWGQSYRDTWWHDRVNAEEGWAFTRGDDVTVAVLDTGLDVDHPDIANNVFVNEAEANGLPGVDDDGNGFVDDVNGWDFVFGDNSPDDFNGHGSHVAGIVGAVADNLIGFAGIAPNSKILPVRVLDSEGNGFFSDLFAGIRYAADLGAQVINMSLGAIKSLLNGATITEMQEAIDYARGKGSILVAAAGNNNGLVSDFAPAGMENLISVGATNPVSDAKASYSNYGPELDLVAPGTDILSLKTGESTCVLCDENPFLVVQDDYLRLSGTSMSSPMVAGAVALLKARDPLLTYDDILRRLHYSAEDLGEPGKDDFFGYGMLDVFEALSTDYYTTGEIKTRWLAEADAEGVVELEYDLLGRITRKIFEDGSYAQITYWTGTANRFEQIFFDVNDVWVKTEEYWPDGVTLHFIRWANGDVWEYDENGNRINGDPPAGSTFTDDFNRTALGTDWTIQNGSPFANGSVLTFGNSFPQYYGSLTLNQEPSSPNYELEVSTYFGGQIAARGFIFRYQNEDNYYQMAVDKWGRVWIQKKENGVLTDLGGIGWIGYPDQNSWNRVKLVVEGNNFKVYYKDELKVERTDAVNTFTNGKVGLFTNIYGESFDDFSLVTEGGGSPPVVVPPPTVNAIPAFTNQSPIVLSGNKEAGTSIWINGVEVVSADASTTWNANQVLNVEQLYNFSITAKDVDGNESASVDVSTTYDITAPVIQVTSVVPAYTNNATLVVDYTWDGNVAQTSFNLSENNNPNLIISHPDAAGNLGQSNPFSVILDTIEPTGSVLINSDDATTEDPNVNLTITQTETNVDVMRISVDGGVTFDAWIPAQATADVTLPAGNGVKEVRVEFRDKAGNVSTQVISDTIELVNQDPPPPTGDTYTDDFNRVGLGSDWTVHSGNPQVNGAHLTFGNSFPQYFGSMTLNQVPSSQNYEVEVSTYFGGQIAARGILFRYQDSNNYYRMGFDKWGRVWLEKMENGVLSTIGGIGWIGYPDQNSWNRIKLVVEGNNFKVYYKGELKVERTDAANTFTTGKVGLFTNIYGESFDNFSLKTNG